MWAACENIAERNFFLEIFFWKSIWKEKKYLKLSDLKNVVTRGRIGDILIVGWEIEICWSRRDEVLDLSTFYKILLFVWLARGKIFLDHRLGSTNWGRNETPDDRQIEVKLDGRWIIFEVFDALRISSKFPIAYSAIFLALRILILSFILSFFSPFLTPFLELVSILSFLFHYFSFFPYSRYPSTLIFCFFHFFHFLFSLYSFFPFSLFLYHHTANGNANSSLFSKKNSHWRQRKIHLDLKPVELSIVSS